jgi:hypothetical protein
MARRKSFWQKLATELIWLPFTLAFIFLVAWFCFFVLPDFLTGMFLDTVQNQP